MEFDTTRLIVSILGFGGTITALLFGVFQYRRSERWKRAEFVAKEIKEFESDRVVRNALLMIDWGVRKFNLNFVPNEQFENYIEVTREMQRKALMPHSSKAIDDSEASACDGDGPVRGFTSVEALIRDTYDVLLDHLERFGNFVRSGLVSKEEFEPYLIYWLQSMTSTEGSREDRSWRLALLTYISFYRYPGVNYLFKVYGMAIEPGGATYSALMSSLENDPLSRQLYQSVQPSGG
jgi:hypothetical protein